MLIRTRLIGLSLASVGLFFVACAGGGGGGPASQSRTEAESAAKIKEQLDAMQPTTHTFAQANPVRLWEATKGYMQHAFKLEEPPNGDIPVNAPAGSSTRYVESKVIEWFGDGMLHRTRVMAKIEPEPGSLTDMRLSVLALVIEPVPQFELAQENRPVPFEWQLQGNNPMVEKTVKDAIVKRYICAAEGRPIPDDELVVFPSTDARKTATPK